LTHDGLSITKAKNDRIDIYTTIYTIFKEFDLLITPTTAVTAFDLGMMFSPKINKKNVSPTGWQAFSFPFNLTVHPAASIPCGWFKTDLPIGMQLVGRRFDNETVLKSYRAFEEACPWQTIRLSFS
jgi:aspartyl-tRNA(Asn)/glutamyl-tRNA(Gln) amidotransferase subunit A